MSLKIGIISEKPEKLVLVISCLRQRYELFLKRHRFYRFFYSSYILVSLHRNIVCDGLNDKPEMLCQELLLRRT